MAEPTAAQLITRANAFTAAMFAMKGSLEGGTVGERYERLRERYVTGSIDLEEFAAAVVSLLRQGL